MTKQTEALKMAIEMLTTIYLGKQVYETEQLMRVADFCKEALAEQPNRQDEARERWLDQLADECSDPNL